MNDNRFVKKSFDMLFLLLAFVKNVKKTFLFTFTYGDAHLLESRNEQSIFSFYFNFIIYSQLVKGKEKIERRIL